jgi:thymidylate synthase (FAD)
VKFNVLDHGSLELDAHCASDLAVVNAARVSLNQGSDKMTEKDEGLIRFLMKNRHGTPFEHGFFRFIVKCPLFVAREWHRHRVGHSYNEWSGRYSVIEPEFYIPDHIRVQTGKPGAYTFEEIEREEAMISQWEMEQENINSFATYERLLERGVAKEQARMVLPVATYTKFYWSCNPRSLMHFLSLRTAEQAMYEIRVYANMAERVLERYMPVTWEAFVDNGCIAP